MIRIRIQENVRMYVVDVKVQDLALDLYLSLKKRSVRKVTQSSTFVQNSQTPCNEFWTKVLLLDPPISAEPV